MIWNLNSGRRTSSVIELYKFCPIINLRTKLDYNLLDVFSIVF